MVRLLMMPGTSVISEAAPQCNTFPPVALLANLPDILRCRPHKLPHH